MQRLLIVSHTPSLNTRALTKAVLNGARAADIKNVEVRCLQPLQADESDVLWAQAIIIGTTENFGYMSGALKDFFDRIYYPCLEKTPGLAYALFIKAGMDGSGAQSSVERIIKGLGWRAVQAPLVMTGSYQKQWLTPCYELGLYMAAGLEAGVF